MLRMTTLAIMLIVLLSGCIMSPAGFTYLKTKGKGDEEEITGVVNGIWNYDQSDNLARLKKYLPDEDEEILTKWSTRYQVRVGFKQSIIESKFVDIALLPDGWSHTPSNDAQDENIVQPGDLVVVSAQPGRLVDHVVSLSRRCDAEKTNSERPELSIGCFEIRDYDKNGYGGKVYKFLPF